jgi:ribosomal RNA methyltransferase Nop2
VEDEEAFVLPPAGEMDQDGQAPHLKQVHKRKLKVLRYFGDQQEEGWSLAEYLSRFQKYLASYGDFLLSKLMDLFPLSELI